jgi:hypothetical protein
MRTRDQRLEQLHRDSAWFDLALASTILLATLALAAVVLR